MLHRSCEILIHGGETIMSNDFQDFLAHNGIFWQTGPRNTPNYNAIGEHNIQTLKGIYALCTCNLNYLLSFGL